MSDAITNHDAREQLAERMDFDHVIEVHADGTVTDADGVYAPEDPTLDDESVSAPWALMNGYSGQYGYAGPIMHPSEFIGGGLARDILAQPGYYVAILATDLDDGEPYGWAVAYREV